MFDIKLKCHWHDEICKGNKHCEGCERQPPDDEKRNGQEEPVHIRWVDGYSGHKEPECPSCGALLYSFERCLFCGQRFLPDKITDYLNCISSGELVSSSIFNSDIMD